MKIKSSISCDKFSARRMKFQIYLRISEPPPKFCLCEAQTKVVQTERNIKSQCLRSTRSRTSEDIEKATNNKTFCTYSTKTLWILR